MSMKPALRERGEGVRKTVQKLGAERERERETRRQGTKITVLERKKAGMQKTTTVNYCICCSSLNCKLNL